MTRQEICQRMAERHGKNVKEAYDSLNQLLNEIKLAINEGHDVIFRGFGSFKIVERKAKAGRNLKDNTPLHVPARKVVKFKVSKELNEVVK